MSTVIQAHDDGDLERLQRRVHDLGRDALQGVRPLSELLGEAISQLHAMLGTVRGLRAELDGGAAHRPLPRSLPGDGDDGRDAGIAVPAAPLPPADEPPRPRLDFFERPVPEHPAALEVSLRARIAGAVYLGTLGAGDRLPSLRDLARRTGLNHKVVRRVYRSLERGGFIEVRDRSGIYVPGADGEGGAGDVDAWMARVVVEAIQHGIRADTLPALLDRVVGAGEIRCACVDSTEDDRFALCREIRERFGLRTVAVPIAADAPAADVAEADVVVTTPFHAEQVRSALAPGQPLVVATLHPALRQAVDACAGDGELRIVCVEQAAGDRLRHSLGPSLARRARVVALDGGATRDQCLEAPAVATLAGWARLGGGDPPPHLAVPPYLSAGATRQLASVLVQRSRKERPGPVG